MTMTVKVLRIQTLNVVREQDLEYAAERDFSYEGPSYGGDEAEFVLVWPEQLIAELEARNQQGKYDRLINEMRALPPNTYIGLDG